MQNTFKHILFQSFLIVSLLGPVHAAQIAGVTFGDHYHADYIIMPLQGTGIKNVMFFKAFVAGYYTDIKSQPDDLGEFPKRIEVEYFVNIPGSKLNNYTIDRMKYNVSSQELAELKPEIELMGKYFVDLKPGDRFALTYLPGIGTQFEYRGNITGTIEGSRFAKALFSVWIGEKPFDESLKLAIMGAAKGQEPDNNLSGITPGYASSVIAFGPKETLMNGSIKYSVIGRYNAHFNAFTGNIAVDEASNNIQSVSLEIDAASIQSSCAWCDKIVRSPQVLNTKVYPKITFKSNEIIRDDKKYSVKGILEMHGKSKEVVFPFIFNMNKDASTGQTMLEVSGKWDINRKDFDIIWNKFLDHGGVLVGDYIYVEWGIKVKVQ